MRRTTLLGITALLFGCSQGGDVPWERVDEPRVRVDKRIEFPSTEFGEWSAVDGAIGNEGGSPVRVRVETKHPFRPTLRSFELKPGETRPLRFFFEPGLGQTMEPGTVAAVARVITGETERRIALIGLQSGKESLNRGGPDSCSCPEGRGCLLPEGSICDTPCGGQGACLAGACIPPEGILQPAWTHTGQGIGFVVEADDGGVVVQDLKDATPASELIRLDAAGRERWRRSADEFRYASVGRTLVSKSLAGAWRALDAGSGADLWKHEWPDSDLLHSDADQPGHSLEETVVGHPGRGNRQRPDPLGEGAGGSRPGGPGQRVCLDPGPGGESREGSPHGRDRQPAVRHARPTVDSGPRGVRARSGRRRGALGVVRRRRRVTAPGRCLWMDLRRRDA
ncbi:hypothetical protein AKJ08_1763 [Vulgatibacter incomptus]|uniref:Lipoprotein n=1 Tax=Vulgatibacter incomptus TaxID=1391653 RepID=A0A0K1PD96_9BACT|nr:hypothetical protein AKJ08_1763 [Vulgatibacter incomptus]